MNQDLRGAWRFFLAVVRSAVWAIQTVALGVGACLALLRFLGSLGKAPAELLICPRWHDSPAYGVFECRSSAPAHLHEGWVFSRCRICGLSAGWTPCRVCGLPIQNPAFRGRR